MSTLSALMLVPWMGGVAPAAKPTLVPDARAVVSPQRTFDLTHLGLDLTLLPAQRAVEGTATFTVKRLWTGPMVLDQVALDIQQVFSAAGPLTWHMTEDTLVVDLPADFGVQAAQDFSVSWRATPQTGLHFREGGRSSPDAVSEVWSQGEGEDNRYWFPGWDHPGDRFDYDGVVHAPNGWRAVTNSGVDLVNYLVMVAAGPYEVVTRPDHPNIEVWVPPGTGDQAVARVLDPIPGMMAHFAERTGVPYAWGTYRQIFVQRFLYTGMENTSATIEHARMLVDDRVADTSTWVESVAAHELAHQWFGDLLTCRNWRDLWLNEGFATFFAADWMAIAQGPERHAAVVDDWLKGASDDAKPMAGRFFQGADAPRNHNVYGRGAAVLHMLRVYLGEERFWAGLRAYTQGHQHDLVQTRDLQRAMEAVSGRDLDWFFEQWVELGFVPSLTVKRTFAEGRLDVTVRQKIDDKHPRYSLPVTVEIGLADGTVIRRQGFFDDEELTLSVELEQPPRFVAFDPDGGILAKLSYDQDPVAWAAQLSSPSPLARRAAIRALGETDRSDELVVLLSDSQAPLAEREAAATALGSQRATDPLVTALRDGNARLRRVVAVALGKAADQSPAGALR
ncbi:MAG: M1 family metallopeptidase, partial [Oligoflexia bacterium]|nr:M1 family metallopeptidase [Oligoflexia bacterium]